MVAYSFVDERQTETELFEERSGLTTVPVGVGVGSPSS